MADDALLELSARLGDLLRKHGWRLALAESCTGGWAAQTVTAIPGSSLWFERGFVTYSNPSKIEMLGVLPETLRLHGAVSEHTAREMALGAMRHSHAQCAAAITGIAGPEGGTADKPVGTVCFAWVSPATIKITTLHLSGSRQEIRHQSVECALRGLIELAA